MRTNGLMTMLALLATAACGGGYDGPSSPGDGGRGPGGGPVGTVTVGSGIRFLSQHNGSANPAVDTIEAGGTVTWHWSGSLPHSVKPTGATRFTESGTITGNGTHAVPFATPGTYHYQCGVHGAAMSGTIVVLPPAVQASRTVADPLDDTFHTGGLQWDLTALTVSRDTGGITILLDFSSDVVSPTSGDSSAIVGVVDLDVDQDPATGALSLVDEIRTDSGRTGMGVDAEIVLFSYAPDSSVVVIGPHATVGGRVKPVFQGHRISIRLPRAMLDNDDGNVNAAAIIGRLGRPTDFAPNAGHLTLGEASSLLARGASSLEASPVARAWGTRWPAARQDR